MESSFQHNRHYTILHPYPRRLAGWLASRKSWEIVGTSSRRLSLDCRLDRTDDLILLE
uniref:Uncharacterized protein n=1 Tax=Physcomitrium patens TaxID=3218 RepID=A0A2K1JBH7_PHYPA|nr:hypothetical protein PHYPA_019160 [Physcomitrium patens]